MISPTPPRTPAFDADAINETIQRALASAGLDTTTGPMHEATETIRRALRASRRPGAAPRFDDAAVEIGPRVIPGAEATGRAAARKVSIGEVAQRLGTLETHAFSNEAGTLAYKIHVPAGRSDTPRAMMVMLHGCRQSADDFAAGTQMNRLADEHGFIVVYPEQAARANALKCWNWFQPQDQVRGSGEPSLIAGIVGEVVQKHGADPRRVFVAGLSAGAAMAVVLGETYPDLFAGVGAHSGLAYGSAHDVASAFSAMQGGHSGMPGGRGIPDPDAKVRSAVARAVPVIVFHGDQDHTVQQANGAHIVQQALDAHGAQAGGVGLSASTQGGSASGARRFSRTVHADLQGRARVESWTLHGGGHAWSGGHASGSCTEVLGPDASAEMVRFFLALPPLGPA